MTARRLLVDALPEGGGEVVLPARAARHARVLRLAVGAPVRLFDGRGLEAPAAIVSLDGEVRCAADPPVRVTHDGAEVVLVQCLPKGAKLDVVVRMATEVGVAAVRLAIAERSVARPDEARAAARTARLSRIAAEAARQSLRATVPEVFAPAPLAQVTASAPRDAARLFLDVGARAAAPVALDGPCWIVVGPEGGLTAAERAALREQGWQPVGLGAGVLRVETAAVVAVALARDRLGALRPRDDEGFGSS